MSTRLIATLNTAQGIVPILAAKVYRDTDSDGYVVKFFKSGKYRPQADYETNDQNDAVCTARRSIEMATNANK